MARYPRGRHELIIGPTVIDTQLPETQAARAAARLLAADSAIRAHDGDADAAIDSCRAILNTGRSIGDEPFAISQLVRVAIGRTAMSSTRRVLGQGQASDASLAPLQALILDEAAQPLLLHALRGERATINAVIRRFAAGELPVSSITGGNQRNRLGVAQALGTRLMGLFAGNQRAVALEWMNEAVAIAPPRYRTTTTVGELAGQDRQRRPRPSKQTDRRAPAPSCPGIIECQQGFPHLPGRARGDSDLDRRRATPPQNRQVASVDRRHRSHDLAPRRRSTRSPAKPSSRSTATASSWSTRSARI